MQSTERITITAIIINIILFIAKFIVGIISNSISLLSDALNSFIDIFSSIIVHIAVKISGKKADEDHPFGHRRAEPLAALTVAILTAVLGFEIAKTAIFGFFTPRKDTIGLLAIIILLINIAIKAVITVYFTKKAEQQNSPALKATGIDASNDILVSIIALIGVAGTYLGYSPLDNIAALIISGFILYFGYKFAVENIDYLMGKSPPVKFLENIKSSALKITEVKGVNTLRAHYVGNYVHVEIHIEVNKNISTKESHDIGKKVQRHLETIKGIEKAFVHIDPI